MLIYENYMQHSRYRKQASCDQYQKKREREREGKGRTLNSFWEWSGEEDLSKGDSSVQERASSWNPHMPK